MHVKNLGKRYCEILSRNPFSFLKLTLDLDLEFSMTVQEKKKTKVYPRLIEATKILHPIKHAKTSSWTQSIMFRTIVIFECDSCTSAIFQQSPRANKLLPIIMHL